jgi:hypothetical protein
VSLFGPGVGECVVLHFGDGTWAIVDSCLDRASRAPIALEYLREIGVPTSAVKLVAITHWHDDHMRGAAEVVEACTEADIICSQALRADEFIQLCNAGRARPAMPGPAELGRVMSVVESRASSTTTRRRLAADDQLLYRVDSPRTVEVHSLSPSSESCVRAARDIAKYLPKKLTPIRFAAPTANDVAVALWVRVGDIRVLLGADLEQVGDDSRGWKAIVGSTTRPAGVADVFKVPHHGSENGHNDDVWNNLLSREPLALVSPFASGRKPLPSPDDVARMLARSKSLYCTSRPKGWKPPARDRAVDRTIDAIARDRRAITGPMGHVRVRVPCDDPSAMTVELFGGAEHLAA